jgi:hypothetical protein
MRTNAIRRWLLAPLAVALLGLTACDNPLGGGDEHPNGVVILSGGTEVATYIDGVSTGAITLPVSATHTYRVQLTTRSGARFNVDGAEYSLRQPAVLLGTLATVTLQGTDQLVVTGRAAGPTTIVLPVHHGNHLEFDARINLVLQ